MKSSVELLLGAIVTFAAGPPASADNLPGDYNPFPAGTRIVTLRYTYGSGDDLYARGSKVDGDFHFQDQQLLLTCNYYAGQRMRWGLTGALPVGQTEASSDRLHLESADSGFGDAYVVAGVWPLIGENYHLGFSGWVFVPIGSYQPERLINQGLNAWSWKEEVNLTWKPRSGWALELTAASRQFADNHDFGPGHARLERAPRNTLETHIVKSLRGSVRVSLDYFYHWGGETSVNGYARDDQWDDHAAQLTGTWRIDRARALTFWYRDDFRVRSGVESESVGIRMMQGF